MGRSAGHCRPFPFVEPNARLTGRITFRGRSVPEHRGHILAAFLVNSSSLREVSTAKEPR
jgi:hypothetical protein